MIDYNYPSDFDHEKICLNCDSIFDKRFNEACPTCDFDDQIHDVEEFRYNKENN